MALRTKFNPLGVNNLPYKIGQVLWAADGSSAPTQWFDLPQGIYEISAVGAGGTGLSGLNMYAVTGYAGGGSGGFAICNVKIPKGKYLFFPGATNVRDAGVLAEDGTAMFIAYNGTNATSSDNLVTPVNAGAGGGVLYPSKFEIVQSKHWTGGNNGSYNLGSAAAGGASVDPYSGYGKGADCPGDPTTGFIKLIYLGRY